MKKHKYLLLVILIVGLINQASAQPSFVWGKQFGTVNGDSGQDIVCNSSGDIILTGSTTGSLFSNNIGKSDGYIIKLDSLGREIWKKQFGTNEQDKVWELEKDKYDNLYVAGNTFGVINGKGYGEKDIAIYKFDKDGNLMKNIIIGTDSTDFLSEIFIDSLNNIFIAGNTKGKIGEKQFGDWDYFVMELDSNFNKIKVLQFGTEKWDYCNDFMIDKEGNFYIVGFTFGNLGNENIGNSDAFLAKYNKNGDLLKIKQFGTVQHDNIANIKMDRDENIYISGTSHGDIVNKNKGKSDVFIKKFDKNWETVWEEQYGTNSWDEAWHMDFFNTETEILISGSHNPNAYIRSYDNHGNLKWNQIFSAKGIKAGTGGRHFTIFNDKYIYFTGFTFANLFSRNPNQKEDDIFIVKLGIELE